MYCKYCGTQNSEESRYCSNCGASINANAEQTISESVVQQTAGSPVQQPTASQPIAKKSSGKAIAGFVLSLVGLVFAGIVCGTLGLIFSALGMKETADKTRGGRGLAIAGLVISIIDIVIMFIYYMLPIV